MVVVELSDEQVDRMFHALADATRRDILTRCIDEMPSVTELAAHYPMSFAAVQKHVAVLEDAGLVSKTQDGRKRVINTELERLKLAQQLLDEYEVKWRDRLARMSQIIDEEQE